MDTNVFSYILAVADSKSIGKVFDTVLFRVLPGMDDKRTLL